MRLRSAHRGNANNVWYVNTTGNVNNNNANNAYRSAPGLRKHRRGKPCRKHGAPECGRRRKLCRLVQKAKRGEITKEHVDKCYQSWLAHAAHGNTYKVVQHMDEYYKSLWR